MNQIIPASLACALLLTFGCAKKNEFQAPPPPEETGQKTQKKYITDFKALTARLEGHQ